MITPLSMRSLAKNKSSASNLSLNPRNLSNHRSTTDCSIWKNLRIIEPGTLPAETAAAKSSGKLSNHRPSSASATIASSLLRSLSSSSSPPPLPQLPLPPPLPDELPPPRCAEMAVAVVWTKCVVVKVKILSLKGKKIRVGCGGRDGLLQ